MSRRIAASWNGFWFGADAAIPLEVVRAGTGIAFVLAYAPMSGDLATLYGAGGLLTSGIYPRGALPPSLLAYVPPGWPLDLVHAVFLVACAALAAGWQTRTAKWLVLLGHLSYVYRNPGIRYGLDETLASLAFVLCLAPVGRALSVDGWRGAAPRRVWDGWASACLRLLQIQVAVVVLDAAVWKLAGQTWRAGDAVWVALTNHEFANVPVGWLADHFWAVRAITWGTLAFEVAYPVVIWPARTRPWALAGALLLHAGMGAMLGLYVFSFAMIVAHLAFVPREWLVAARATRALAGEDGR